MSAPGIVSIHFSTHSLISRKQKATRRRWDGRREALHCSDERTNTKRFCCASEASASDGEINIWPTKHEEESQIEEKSCLHDVLICYFLLQNAKLYRVSLRTNVQSASLQSVNKSLGCDWVMQVRARVGEMEMRPYLICGKPTALNQYRPERERLWVSYTPQCAPTWYMKVLKWVPFWRWIFTVWLMMKAEHIRCLKETPHRKKNR